MKDFKKCKFGMFIHHILEGAYYADGSRPKTIDEMADAFDVEGFADSVARMGVDYILYTAWNFATQPLYPSAVSERWRPGNCPKRDLLGEIIDAVRARGIHVMLYTHPRDGHDFSEEDKERTGWGRGGHETDDQQPNHANFQYEKWNQYIYELYEELAQRYADRLTGYYTDSNGPKDPQFNGGAHPHKDHHLVNYVNLRSVMKSYNPNLITFQNYYGYLYTQDYGNSECYTGYIESKFGYKNAEKWHSTKGSSITMLPFASGYSCAPVRTDEDNSITTPNEIIRFALFNGSCSACGNILLASGTHVEGNVWSAKVEEFMCEVGKELSRFDESFMNALPSRSYPTFPGSTLEENHFRFWMADPENHKEYLHCICLPEEGVMEWGLAEDGMELTNPKVLTGDIVITGFEKTENGYILRYTGTPDKTDTVISFDSVGVPVPYGYEWINSGDKRIGYTGDWYYTTTWRFNETDNAAGCYEHELQCAYSAESSLYLAFEGSTVEVYGVCAPDYGVADVYIDSVYCGTIDQQAEEQKSHVLCFRSANLYGGTHFLQLYTRNEKTFTIDAIKVIQ